jgi:hypothetical protein
MDLGDEEETVRGLKALFPGLDPGSRADDLTMKGQRA